MPLNLSGFPAGFANAKPVTNDPFHRWSVNCSVDADTRDVLPYQVS